MISGDIKEFFIDYIPLWIIVSFIVIIVMIIAYEMGRFDAPRECIEGTTVAICNVGWCVNNISEMYDVYNVTATHKGDYIVYYDRVCG